MGTISEVFVFWNAHLWKGFLFIVYDILEAFQYDIYVEQWLVTYFSPISAWAIETGSFSYYGKTTHSVLVGKN